MGTIFLVISATLVVILGFCIVLLIRNERVYNFHKKLLEEESELTRKRIDEGKGYDGYRRFAALPDYDKMANEFWKPLQRYYKPLSDYYEENKKGE